MASIPTYFISIFKIPASVANKVEKLQRDFLWGDGRNKRKIHYVKWSDVCKKKAIGGLGIGCILDKNKGILAKWVWRFGTERGALWGKVIVAKYRINGNQLLWFGSLSPTDSFFVKAVNNLWKEGSISAVLIEEGFGVVIGKEDRADFWNDIKWNSRSLKAAFPRVFALAAKKNGPTLEFGRWIDAK
ncbi:hypothetical protein Ddye_009757 [Dipteronia dyeriana]|uniref:Uncharacterized protein n=1 Tax=Dipteronia dyeriana TaxID=168575 RepID=A0AAD9XC83_9ROSI|nr:hypothetical protein Ddye_009757 [Dipteronia dyeriana]